MKQKEETVLSSEELKDFTIEVKRDILDIITDCPSLVKLGDKEYRVKNMRYYTLYRICKLATGMIQADERLDDNKAIVSALCTDLDAMCEIIALILCNHMFTPDRENADEKNDELVRRMKTKVMNSTYDDNQWAAIILGAIKSIDLTGFFLLRKSVNTLTDSLLTRKKKSTETVSQFMEAQSLRTQPTSSKSSHNTD